MLVIHVCILSVCGCRFLTNVWTSVDRQFIFIYAMMSIYLTFVCSYLEFDKIYDRLDIKIVERGESFYQPLMPGVVKDLEEKGAYIVSTNYFVLIVYVSIGLITMDEGRKVVFVPEDKVPLTVEKSDGGYTYDTSDMTALRHRVFDERGDWVIYVVDSGQVHTAFSHYVAGCCIGSWFA